MTTVTKPRPSAPARLLSLPIAVELVENDGNGDAWLELPDGWAKIVSMKNLWELDGYQEQEQPVIRMHFRATTESGRGVLLYQDLLEGRWYRQLTLGNETGSQPTPIYRA